jgi:hypothetical protein
VSERPTNQETTTFDALLGAVEPEILAAQRTWLRHRAELEAALLEVRAPRLRIVPAPPGDAHRAANVA